ncbi:YIPF1-like protein, partial [Trifolium medium]|nr:YIPF1-like protein [Trifolium medium]
RVGDRERILFWKDSWVDGIPFKSQFSRLFELSLDKDGTVADVFRLGWGYGGNGWRWRRLLFAREKELWGECCSVLANVLLQVDISDEWEWLSNPKEGYSVHGIPCVLADNAIALASQFGGTHDFHKSSNNCLQVVWLATICCGTGGG